MMRSITSRRRKALIKLAVVALWLIVWQLAYMAVGEELLLVSPLTVFWRIIELAGTASFWGILANSFLRIMLGFLLGTVTGVLIAILTANSEIAHQIFQTPMNIIKATPVVSFIILALIWISGSNLSIFIAFLMVLPLIWSNTHEGIKKTDKQLLEMGRVFRLSRGSVISNIYIPSVLPFFLSAIKVALGFAWKAGISGEVIAIPRGAIGTQLYNAKIYLETADLFAWTVIVILLSIVLEKLMVRGIGSLAERMNRLRVRRDG